MTGAFAAGVVRRWGLASIGCSVTMGSFGCGAPDPVVTTPDTAVTAREARPAPTTTSAPSAAPTFVNTQLAGGVELGPGCPAGERAAFLVIDPSGSCVLTKALPKEAASRCVPSSSEVGPPVVTCSIGAFGLIYVSMEGRRVGPECAAAVAGKFANPPAPLSACGG